MRRSAIMSRTVVALLASTFAACSAVDQTPPESWTGAGRTVMSHPSGLVIEIPEALYKVARSATGFQLQRPGIRGAGGIRIDRVERTPPTHDLRGGELRGHEVLYWIEEIEGGMGGEYVLHAWRPEAHGAVMLTQHVQIESGDPSFVDGWAVLAKTRTLGRRPPPPPSAPKLQKRRPGSGWKASPNNRR